MAELREILFRGKRLDNDEWVEGSLVQKVDPLLGTSHHFVLSQGHGESFVTWYMVDPSTIGQYTGLMDKNGKRIFEGDIVGYCWYDATMNFQIDFVSGEFLAVPIEKRKGVWAIRISGQGESFEVIGNIHDDPELIGGGQQ